MYQENEKLCKTRNCVLRNDEFCRHHEDFAVRLFTLAVQVSKNDEFVFKKRNFVSKTRK